jgi:hypothetical protein
MMRISLLVALIAALAFAAQASPAEQNRIASHCSASGDVCYGIFLSNALYRFKLTTAARYFSHYRICVKPAGLTGTCKRFPVRKVGASWGGTVIWQRNFPQRGPRVYRVTWKLGSQRLGPPLSFVLPAPV